MAQEDSIEILQNQWKEMFQKSLPKAAISRSTVQKEWPVTLDHCFARIILDKIVGIDTPWTKKIKTPAYKNMSREQLQTSIDLGNQILRGEVDLVELDDQSLSVRGKTKHPKKRKLEEDTDRREEAENTRPKKKIASTPEAEEDKSTTVQTQVSTLLTQISRSTKTPFQKSVLSLLCQIPRGRYTTYAALAAHLRSSPRAVGGALKNNQWAPQVPCHRVLAADGGIGGFHGSWGRNGERGVNDDKKMGLLRGEGVMFDGKGMAVGGVWKGFV